MAKLIPWMMSETKAVSLHVELVVSVELKTLTATIFASGATPFGPAMIPETEVPCPSQSMGSLSSSAVSIPPMTLEFGNPPPPSAETE